MLVPRAVDLHSNRPAINIIHVTEHKPSPPMIRFHFMVSVILVIFVCFPTTLTLISFTELC